MNFSPFLIIAGPCVISSYDSFYQTALEVEKSGATMIRGGIFKLRTNASSFQGLEKEGIAIVREIKKKISLPFVTEITDPRQIDLLFDVADVFLVGTRNMHNYSLLKELGRIKKKIILKRGFSAYLDEWLLSTEYITQGGNTDIILCERGIRTFERATRNTLDLSAIPYLKQRCLFPIIVDPSHGTGDPQLIPAMTWASTAAGADGVMLEVYHNPQEAVSDAQQAIDIQSFQSILKPIQSIRQAIFQKD